MKRKALLLLPNKARDAHTSNATIRDDLEVHTNYNTVHKNGDAQQTAIGESNETLLFGIGDRKIGLVNACECTHYAWVKERM